MPRTMSFGLGMDKRLGSRNWTPQSIASKLLFWGKVSEIAGGQMPNKLGSDFLTVTGSNYQCPNTSPYNTADTDYLWFNSDDTQRVALSTELIAYDFSRTLVKYDDNSPNTLREIIILKNGETLTEDEENNVRDYFRLSIWWDGTLSLHGVIKDNRTISRSIFNNAYNVLIDGNTSAWYDATDASLVTKNGSNHVTVLKNKLGVTTKDLTTVGGTPIWSADGILFDGVDDYLKRTFNLALILKL